MLLKNPHGNMAALKVFAFSLQLIKLNTGLWKGFITDLVFLALKKVLYSQQIFRQINTHTHTYIYVYIYIWICVCIDIFEDCNFWMCICTHLKLKQRFWGTIVVTFPNSVT